MAEFFISIIGAIITYAIIKYFLRWCDKHDQDDKYLDLDDDDYWLLFM